MKYVLTSYDPADDLEIGSNPLPLDRAKTIYAETLGLDVQTVQICEGEEIVGLHGEATITLRPATADELIDKNLDLDSIVEGFSDERFQLAFRRATAEFGGLVTDHESEEFAEEFAKQLKQMAVGDAMSSWTDEGEAEAVETDEDGNILYKSLIAV